MNRQAITADNYLSRQYIIHDLTRPLSERVKSRKVCGPYYGTRSNAQDAQTIFYYADSYGDMGDGPALLRTTANDTQYYTDDDGVNDTITGIVATLPRSRGFLAGWSMGAGMCSELERTVYDNADCARRAADDIAERVAERERYGHEVQDLEYEIDDLRETISDTRAEFHALRADISDTRAERNDKPALTTLVCQHIATLRNRVHESVRRITDCRDEIDTINRYYLA